MSLDFILLGTKYTGEPRHSQEDKYHSTAHSAFVATVLMSAQIGAKLYELIVYILLSRHVIIYLDEATGSEGLCLHTNNVVC